MTAFHSRTTGILGFLLLLVAPTAVDAQPRPSGVVTALQGKASLTRTSLKSDLRFKESILLRDVIDTQEKSRARILFGGKSTVTVRELSRLEVSEEALPTGPTYVVNKLSTGAALIHVARRLMRPGDEVQIRTPNAVAAVRGTTIYVEYIPSLEKSVFILFSGAASVQWPGGSTITLTPMHEVTVTGAQLVSSRLGAIVPISPSRAERILQAFRLDPEIKEAAIRESDLEEQLEVAAQLANEALRIADLGSTAALTGSNTLSTVTSSTGTTVTAVGSALTTTLSSTTTTLSTATTTLTSPLTSTVSTLSTAPLSTTLPSLP